MKLLFVLALVAFSCASAVADSYSLFVPEKQDPTGIFTLTGDGFPYTIEIYLPGAIPAAHHMWSVQYGHGAARGVPHPADTDAFDPNLSQYNITPPDGWELVAVNEDATLAIIVPEPADITYDQIFENGVMKENTTLRIFPVKENLEEVLKVSQEPNFILGKPDVGNLVCGTDDFGRMIAKNHILAKNENVKFCSSKTGTSVFEIALREGSSETRIQMKALVSENPYAGVFADDPTEGKRWIYETTGRGWTWGHNINNRLTRLTVEITLGGNRICRSILIPNSNPRFNGTVRDCDSGPLVKAINYEGTCPYRPGQLPAVTGSVSSDADGKYSIEVPYPWTGHLRLNEVQACPPAP